MNLTIDIGNSRVKIGLFDGSQLAQKWSWEFWQAEELLALATNLRVKNIILSTVADTLPAQVEQVFRENFYYLPLNNQTPLPFNNLYRTPQTLGKDRLAAVAGALALFPAQHCLAIDAGTCITFDLLTGAGDYLGGNISPGVRMRLKAMHAYTARLPELEPDATDLWLGYSTDSAMRNGAQWGAAFEIEGTIAQCRAFYDPIHVILTGGDADFLAKMMKSQIFVHAELVLFGLNKILEYNVNQVA
ncbi:MAG: type III pantothenate kinase [Saprospiraceae bacterium]|jgi:type III pantothenate kinase|nr:type III pantothenate kinase [Saprospiraceae bacterium]